MTAYTFKDAERDLQTLLDRAPQGAVTGAWETTTMQAGHSSGTGSYYDTRGDMIDQPPGQPLGDIGDILEKLADSTQERFNKAHIRWTKAGLPFMKGKVTIDLVFDAAIVPRGPGDPAYEVAAKARRAYWQTRGEMLPGFAAERDAANVHGQTKWFNPHRRIVHIRGEGRDMLATDGLSTPWAGISEQENGVECELMLAFDEGELDEAHLKLWAHLMIGIGDLVADGYRIARDVAEHRAILFCRTGEDYLPLSRIILSRTDQMIEGLPFGAVPLIHATPVTEEEIADRVPDEDWNASAAREALRRRGMAF